MHSFLSLFGPSPARPNPPPDTVLKTSRLVARMGDPADWQSWRQLRHMSRDFLVPWEPEWSPDALDYSFFCGYLRQGWRLWRQGKAYAFMIFLRKDNDEPGALIGCINLNDVQRGIAQKGTLGYWIGQPYAGQGYMTEATRLVCDFAFDVLRLHRVEASCLPHNEPSKALLKKAGFEHEGFAREYLKINGKWEDHLLWGKVGSPAS